MHRSYDTDRFDASPPDEHRRSMGHGWDGRKLPKRPPGRPANPASHRTPGNVRNSSIDRRRARFSPLPNGSGPDRTATFPFSACCRPEQRYGMTTSERIAGAVLCGGCRVLRSAGGRPPERPDRTGSEQPRAGRAMETDGGGIERCWWLLLPLCASSDPNSDLLSCRVLSFQLSTTRTPQRDAQHWRRLHCARGIQQTLLSALLFLLKKKFGGNWRILLLASLDLMAAFEEEHTY